MFHSAEAFFRPRSVAIVGASETGGAGWPKAIYANLEFADFPTRVYLINPRREELWGRKVYPDFASLPEPVDMALTTVRSAVGVFEERGDAEKLVTEIEAHGIDASGLLSEIVIANYTGTEVNLVDTISLPPLQG